MPQVDITTPMFKEWYRNKYNANAEDIKLRDDQLVKLHSEFVNDTGFEKVILNVSNQPDDEFNIEELDKQIGQLKPDILIINSYQQSELSSHVTNIDEHYSGIEIHYVDRDSRDPVK